MPFSPEQLQKLTHLLRLKNVRRKGWTRHPIEEVESVADHTFGVCLLAWFGAPEHLDRMRVMEMALLHDLAEVLVGDITPHDQVPSEVKVSQELEALSELTSDLPNSEECLALLMEYQAQQTEESKWVKAMDKLDMTLQSWLYESTDPNLDLQEFRRSAEASLRLVQMDEAATGPSPL